MSKNDFGLLRAKPRDIVQRFHTHDAILDGIADAQVTAGALEDAITTLRRLEKFDPWSLHQPFVHISWGLANAAKAYAERGDVERAAALLELTEDLWGLLPREEILQDLG